MFGLQERLRAKQCWYEYQRLVCRWSARRRSSNRWLRCAACQRAGREGLLTIARLWEAA